MGANILENTKISSLILKEKNLICLGGFINQSFEEAQPDHKLDVNPNSWTLPKNKNFPVHRNQNRMTNNQAIVSDGVNAQCSIGENNMTDAENAQKKDVNSKMANY